jgi:hypothetical protein
MASIHDKLLLPESGEPEESTHRGGNTSITSHGKPDVTLAIHCSSAAQTAQDTNTSAADSAA